jgi:hypothetical protein
MFEVSAEETIELAQPLGLRCTLKSGRGTVAAAARRQLDAPRIPKGAAVVINYGH